MSGPTPTHIVVHGEIKNVSGGIPANLNLSMYEGAPLMIDSTPSPTQFTQTIAVHGLYGGLVYNIGRIKWVNLWTTDCKVATKILKAGDPVVWENMESMVTFDKCEDTLPLAPGDLFYADAQIHANDDGTLSFKAQITWNRAN
ncbi:hypothetical protein J1N35_028300 [Gossypium stocksii]|uniref:Uncharacterized protein n=1 Tax=Gossypium stocksii TaxID=47602 RepID=A0A9D3UVZ1_9ROSI|nr:hypothetical protein J1N35_028300 [Gossypium stocksii]